MKIALSFLVVALAATPAAAQITGAVYAPARLKSQVTVSSDIVRIGDLIAAQRAYEMNAKVITATDQMLQSTSQMLR